MDRLLWLKPFNGFYLLRFLVSPAFFVLLVRRSVALQVPRVVYHQREVIIIVDRAGDVFVVFHEFLKRNTSVRGRAIKDVVVGFECLQEFHKYLVSGPFATNDVGVLAGVITILNVVDV